MQTIRLKLPPTVNTFAKGLCKRLHTNNIGLVLDVIALVRLNGHGLPTDARIDALVQRQNLPVNRQKALALSLRRRVATLTSLVKLNLFKAMLSDNTLTVTEKAEHLLLSLLQAGKTQQSAECLTCPHLTACEFGKLYGNSVQRIEFVIDPVMQSKVHPDCPSKPTMDMITALTNAVTTLTNIGNANAAQAQALSNTGALSGPSTSLLIQIGGMSGHVPQMDPEQSDVADFVAIGTPGMSSGNGLYHTASYGSGTNFKVVASVVQSISASQLALFELGRTIDRLLANKAKGHYSPTIPMQNESRSRPIKNVSEVTKASSHALADDDRLLAQLASSSLNVREQMKRETRPNCLYVLLDVSGSMSTILSGFAAFKNMRLSRAALASLLVVSLNKRVEQDKGVLMQRCFDNGPGPLLVAENQATFELHRRTVSSCHFNGNGTSIVAAITTGIADIKKADAKSMLNRAELLLITDGEDYQLNSRVQQFRKDLGDIVLNVLDLSGNHSTVLNDLADVYLAPDPANSSLSDFLRMVNKTKKT